MATTAFLTTIGIWLMGITVRFSPACRDVITRPWSSNNSEVCGSGGMTGRALGMRGRCIAQAAVTRATATAMPANEDWARLIPLSIDTKAAEGHLLPSGPMTRPNAREQLEFLSRNAAEVIPREELASKLERSIATGRHLRVKLGLDPTAADVTLGWAVVLPKLREFQDLGHTAVLIVGDFTARVGDPSGKSETRPRLEKKVVEAFAERLLGQFYKVVSRENLEVRYNSEWLEPMSMEDVLRLTASYTVARMLERDDFAKRFAEGRPISVMEFLYPLLQAMDSVAVNADVELGGTDQTFNLLVGRDLQERLGQGQRPQIAMTLPAWAALDGF